MAERSDAVDMISIGNIFYFVLLVLPIHALCGTKNEQAKCGGGSVLMNNLDFDKHAVIASHWTDPFRSYEVENTNLTTTK